MTNAARLAEIGGGGTACSAPLAKLNREKAKVDLVLIVSDNEFVGGHAARAGDRVDVRMAAAQGP